MNPPEQGPDTGNTAQPLTRTTRRGRRLTLDDARNMAALCAKRLSEAEGCATLGIPLSTWHHWKAKMRNSEEFQTILHKIKGAKISSHLDNIEKASQKDWRASECYLEKTAPDRFSNKAPVMESGVPVNQIMIQCGGAAGVARLVEKYAAEARRCNLMKGSPKLITPRPADIEISVAAPITLTET